ncbi:MAG: T9SS type A sorting domain-containing protein, partial [bacterium]|nr:T9SS type A sorting domain-containing protein [bacterium]
ISPNPVSSATTIEFSLVEAGEASLTVYDLNGRVVDVAAEQEFPTGTNLVEWSPPDELCNGYYLLCIDTLNGRCIENCILLR